MEGVPDTKKRPQRKKVEAEPRMSVSSMDFEKNRNKWRSDTKTSDESLPDDSSPSSDKATTTSQQ